MITESSWLYPVYEAIATMELMPEIRTVIIRGVIERLYGCKQYVCYLQVAPWIADTPWIEWWPAVSEGSITRELTCPFVHESWWCRHPWPVYPWQTDMCSWETRKQDGIMGWYGSLRFLKQSHSLTIFLMCFTEANLCSIFNSDTK